MIPWKLSWVFSRYSNSIPCWLVRWSRNCVVRKNFSPQSRQMQRPFSDLYSGWNFFVCWVTLLFLEKDFEHTGQTSGSMFSFCFLDFFFGGWKSLSSCYMGKNTKYLIRINFRANLHRDFKMREILYDNYAQQGSARK